jgi:hypothetical protein
MHGLPPHGRGRTRRQPEAAGRGRSRAGRASSHSRQWVRSTVGDRPGKCSLVDLEENLRRQLAMLLKTGRLPSTACGPNAWEQVLDDPLGVELPERPGGARRFALWGVAVVAVVGGYQPDAGAGPH